MSTIRRIAKAVKVAMRSPETAVIRSGVIASPGLGPTLETGTDAEPWRVEVDGTTYTFFFLCGHPRSGTNWIGALLNRHPDVNCHGEYRFEGLLQGHRDLIAYEWHAAYHEPVRSEAHACLRDTVRRVMLASRERRPKATTLGDRTPRGLDVLLEGAPHFLIVRDPRDVLVSSMFVELKHRLLNFSLPRFRDRLEPLHKAINEDPEHFYKHPEQLLSDEAFVRHLATRWSRHVAFDLGQLDRIESGEMPARVRVLRYEKVHADPEGERAEMYRFLGLDPQCAMALDERSRTKPGISNGTPGGHYRKGQPGDWRTYFHEDAKRWFKEAAGEMTVRMGYEEDQDW